MSPPVPNKPSATRVAPPPITVVPPPLPEQANCPTTPPDTPEESPNFFDERFDFEEPFDLLESSELPLPTETTAKNSEEPAEKRSRKRRRRRRRPRSAEEHLSQTTAPPSDNRADEIDPLALDNVDQEPVGDDRETTEAPREHRSKRRRSRHSKKKRRDSGPEAGLRDDRRQAGTSSDFAESRDDDEIDLLAEEDLHMDEGDSLEGDQPARLGFRGIPRWDEVVGMMIDKNLEARSKRSASNPNHGRGNRGSRDNRGKGGGKRRS